MKSRHAKKIRRGIVASKLFWKEFGTTDMTHSRYKEWLAVLTAWGLEGKASARVDKKYRARYRNKGEASE